MVPFIRYSIIIFRFVQFKGANASSSADWVLNSQELESMFNCKTKAIIFNNPNNPLGKVYQRHEIETIANLCMKHNVLVISDDVYEHMVSKLFKSVIFCVEMLMAITSAFIQYRCLKEVKCYVLLPFLICGNVL